MGYQGRSAEGDQSTNQEASGTNPAALRGQAAEVLGGPSASEKGDKAKSAKPSAPEKAKTTSNGNPAKIRAGVDIQRGDKAEPVVEKPEITLSEEHRKALQDAAKLIAERGTSLAIKPYSNKDYLALRKLIAQRYPQQESILQTIGKIAEANPDIPRAEVYAQVAQMISNDVAAKKPNLRFVASPYSDDSDNPDATSARSKPKEPTREERMDVAARRYHRDLSPLNFQKMSLEFLIEEAQIAFSGNKEADAASRKAAAVPQTKIFGSQIIGAKFDIVDTETHKEERIGILYLPLKEWRYRGGGI